MHPVPTKLLNGDRDSGMTDQFRAGSLPDSFFAAPGFERRSEEGSFKLDFWPREKLGEQTLRHGYDPLRDDIANGPLGSH